jgi:hypothetical protein
MKPALFAAVPRCLAGAVIALLGASCSIREMSSTSVPALPNRATAMAGSVGHLMAAKAIQEFPEEGYRTESYRGQAVNFPEPVYMPSPRYPAIYQPIASEKDVWVALVVDREGKVRQAKCLGMSDSYLARSVQRSVSRWTFAPGTVNGVPEEFLISVAVKYRWKGYEI